MATGTRPYFNSTARKFTVGDIGIVTPSLIDFGFTNPAVPAIHNKMLWFTSDQYDTAPAAAVAPVNQIGTVDPDEDIPQDFDAQLGTSYDHSPLVEGKFLRAFIRFAGGLFGQNITPDSAYEILSPP